MTWYRCTGARSARSIYPQPATTISWQIFIPAQSKSLQSISALFQSPRQGSSLPLQSSRCRHSTPRSLKPASRPSPPHPAPAAAAPELLHHLLRVPARRKSGNIRTRSRHRAVKLLDQSLYDLAIRPAHSDCSRCSRSLSVARAGRIPRQASALPARSCRASRKNAAAWVLSRCLQDSLARKQDGLFNGIYEDGQSPRFRAPLHAIDFIHCGEIKRIGRQPVKSVRGNGDHTSACKKIRRITQQFRFGSFRVYSQQFCRQFFGLWRTRDATLQRSASAALIWATLPYPLSPAQ